MITARANANQALYLAKILLHGWRVALDAAETPALAIDEAFLPAVSLHLSRAYGWFLLEITGAEIPVDGVPPASCAELPAVPEGTAVSGELREFSMMEQDGWLAEMLAPPANTAPAGRSPGNLASTSPVPFDQSQADAWANRLEALFSRMRDSLDEY